MQIHFRQSEERSSVLYQMGVRRCYVKQLFSERDAGRVLRGFHHHDGFELHLILKGGETYGFDGDTVVLRQGNYLLIPPRIAHRCAESAEKTRKCSITFSLEEGAAHPFFQAMQQRICAKIPPEVRQAIEFIAHEAGRDRYLSPQLIENRTAEILVLLARAAGYQPQVAPQEEIGADMRLSMARQYIQDNIHRPLGCDEVAAYCHLSTRQLARIFAKEEGKTLTAYIHQQRIACIEQLLADPTLSLRGISDRMHFSSEYYFNAFFKKHAGMTPGAYRKMIAMPDDHCPPAEI